MAAPAVAAPATAAPGPLGEALSSTDSTATFEALLGRLGVNPAEIQPIRLPEGVPATSDNSERAGGFSPPPAVQGFSSTAPTLRHARALHGRQFGRTSVSGGGRRITRTSGRSPGEFAGGPIRQAPSPITQAPALQPPPVPRLVNQTLPRDQDRRILASGGQGAESAQLRRLI